MNSQYCKVTPHFLKNAYFPSPENLAFELATNGQFPLAALVFLRVSEGG